MSTYWTDLALCALAATVLLWLGLRPTRNRYLSRIELWWRNLRIERAERRRKREMGWYSPWSRR